MGRVIQVEYIYIYISNIIYKIRRGEREVFVQFSSNRRKSHLSQKKVCKKSGTKQSALDNRCERLDYIARTIRRKIERILF